MSDLLDKSFSSRSRITRYTTYYIFSQVRGSGDRKREYNSLEHFWRKLVIELYLHD